MSKCYVNKVKEDIDATLSLIAIDGGFTKRIDSEDVLCLYADMYCKNVSFDAFALLSELSLYKEHVMVNSSNYFFLVFVHCGKKNKPSNQTIDACILEYSDANMSRFVSNTRLYKSCDQDTDKVKEFIALSN